MDKVEKFWHSLFRKKQKKGRDEVGHDLHLHDADNNKENVNDNVRPRDTTDRAAIVDNSLPSKVTIKQQELGATIRHGSETFPRQKSPEVPKSEINSYATSPASTRLKKNQAVSSTSLRGRRPADPYDRILWSSTQHFHIPYGTQGRQPHSVARYRSTSRTGLNRSQPGLSQLSLHQQSLSPTSQLSQSVSTLRRQIEPNPANQQHFHVPASGRSRKHRLVYGRPGQKTAMTALMEEMKIRSSTYRNRSPSMNNEEPIQLAHYPSGTPGERAIDNDDYPTTLGINVDDRKRRHSRQDEDMDDESGESHNRRYNRGTKKEDKDEDEEQEEVRLRMREQELRKINSSIGNVFLETIKHRDRIRGSRMANIDPRSAARTPGADKEPRDRLRFISPAWASPSRDTLHVRPWDSMEDLEPRVTLGSSCCANGCASDHIPPANSSLVGQLQYSATSLPRLRPGYTLERPGTAASSSVGEPIRSQTLPYIRSVSGRIIDAELEYVPSHQSVHQLTDSHPAATSTPTPGVEMPVNSHSGILYSTNNNFSWLTLAKYQTEDTLRKSTKNTYFKKPPLKHNETLLDK